MEKDRTSIITRSVALNIGKIKGMEVSFTKEKIEEGTILAFDKPYNWTSFDLVNKIRYYLCSQMKVKKLKVGHAGTLDPLATGVLVICTGKATKKITQIQEMPKEYIADITLGATTPSFDLETETDKEFPTEHITKELVDEIMKMFVGKIAQVPPNFSAKKTNGVRAYEMARNGVEMELMPSLVEIYSIELLDYKLPVLTLKVKCSKGTYIRSLARDIGVALNSGAHLTALRRTAVGEFNETNILDVENFLRKSIFS